MRLQGCEINCSGKSGKDPGQRRGMQVDSGERRMLAEEPQAPGLMGCEEILKEQAAEEPG